MNSNAVSHGRRWFAGVTLEAVAVDPSASLLQAEPWHIIQPLEFPVQGLPIENVRELIEFSKWISNDSSPKAMRPMS